MDRLELSEEGKTELEVSSLTNRDLQFNHTLTELEFYKCDDGDIEITVDNGERVGFFLNREQTELLIKWLECSIKQV